MSVDFFDCGACGKSVCECGPYIRCNDNCERKWCDKECAESEGYRKDEDDDDDQSQSCNFCRNEDVEDSPLLDFVLKHFKLTKKKAKKMYLEKYAKEKS